MQVLILYAGTYFIRGYLFYMWVLILYAGTYFICRYLFYMRVLIFDVGTYFICGYLFLMWVLILYAGTYFICGYLFLMWVLIFRENFVNNFFSLSEVGCHMLFSSSECFEGLIVNLCLFFGELVEWEQANEAKTTKISILNRNLAKIAKYCTHKIKGNNFVPTVESSSRSYSKSWRSSWACRSSTRSYETPCCLQRMKGCCPGTIPRTHDLPSTSSPPLAWEDSRE